MSMRDAAEAGTTQGPEPSRAARHAPRVLMYHYFGDAPGADPERLFVTRRMFVAQLDHLRRRGWRALTLDEYLAALDGAPTPRRSYLLTIDDGHESVASIAAPMLAAAGIPSVLFVCPGLLGDRARWAECYPSERLAAGRRASHAFPTSGWSSGSTAGITHGWRRWTTTPSTGRCAVHAEAVEAVTGVRPGPSPTRSAPTTSPPARAVADAGFDVAFAVAREHGRFAADRIFVQSTDSLLAFRCKLSTGYRLAVPGGRARVAAAPPRASRGRTGTDDAAVPIRFEMTWRGNEAASRGDGELAN